MRYACVRLAQVTLEKFVALAGIEMAGESERRFFFTPPKCDTFFCWEMTSLFVSRPLNRRICKATPPCFFAPHRSQVKSNWKNRPRKTTLPFGVSRYILGVLVQCIGTFSPSRITSKYPSAHNRHIPPVPSKSISLHPRHNHSVASTISGAP